MADSVLVARSGCGFDSTAAISPNAAIAFRRLGWVTGSADGAVLWVGLFALRDGRDFDDGRFDSAAFCASTSASSDPSCLAIVAIDASIVAKNDSPALTGALDF